MGIKLIDDARGLFNQLGDRYGYVPTVTAGVTAAGLGAVGLGALLNREKNVDPYRSGLTAYPMPPAVTQQGAGAGINVPYNPQAMMGNVSPLTAEEIARQIEYENRNVNTSLMTLAQLTALQQQLEGQA